MKIGQDVNMDVNIQEGYQIMEFKKRELFKGGKLNPDADCRFYKHLPSYVLNEMYGSDNPIGVKKIHEDVNLTPSELWEIYKAKAADIDRYSGAENRKFPVDEYEVLNLAADISSYCGIE